MDFLGTRMICPGRVEEVFGGHIGVFGAMGYVVGPHKRDLGAGWPQYGGACFVHMSIAQG